MIFKRFINIPAGKLTFLMSKASGPGGQAVNKSKLNYERTD